MLSYRPGADLPGQLHRWATSVPLRDLVTAFGRTVPDYPIGDLLAWLDDLFAGPHAFPAAPVGLDTPEVPPAPAYDHLLVLGGPARACLQRSEYAARLLRSGRTRAGQVTALGSFRPLGGTETDLLPARYEVDALEAAIRLAFGVTGAADVVRSPGEITPASWTVRTLKTEDAQALRVLAAPSSEPSRRRADTGDTYRFWAREASLEPGARILVVTSPVAVLAEHYEAVRILALPYACGVDTVGFDPARATVPEPPAGADRYVPEIRAAIRSMRRLL